MTNIKYTYEEVKETFKQNSYFLISKEYINSHSKLETICPNGHNYFVKFYCFKNLGNRCSKCSGFKKYTYEEIKEIVEKEGYKLLSTTYDNSMKKVYLSCPINHTYSVKMNSFISSKRRCPKCAGVQKLTLKEVFDFFKKRGDRLLTEQYINSKQKLKVLCVKEHEYQITYNNAYSYGRMCQICFGDPSKKKKTLTQIKEIVEKEGYSLLSSEYKNMHTKMDIICPNKHIYNVKMSDFTTKNVRCPKCSLQGTSKEELEILEWIRSFYPKANKKRFFIDNNNKSKYIEFDIYIEEISLAIEYNGLIWHSERFVKKNKSYEKMIWGNENNIRVINIFQDEWLERKEQIKGFLTAVLNKNEIKIGARKTQVKNINKKQASQFLNDNHIQGSTNTDICFGLFYNESLLGIISGSKHHRQGQQGIFVLNRLAFKAGVSIAGGASKLLKELIKYARQNGYSKLISWSDNRLSVGNVYEKMSFILEEVSKPDYSYVYKNKRISKQSCQKRMLIKKGAIGNTEKEMAYSLGLYRIWDCGKKKWIINL